METLSPELEQIILRLPKAAAWHAERERQEKRQQLVNEIAEIREKQVTELPLLARKEEEAKARLEAAQRALEAAQSEFHEAARESYSTSLGLSNRLDWLRTQLRSMADPRIDEALGVLRRRESDLLNRGLHIWSEHAGFDAFGKPIFHEKPMLPKSMRGRRQFATPPEGLTRSKWKYLRLRLSTRKWRPFSQPCRARPIFLY